MVAFALPAGLRAAEPELAEVLSGNTIPLTLKLKDLDASWRKFNLESATTPAGTPAGAYLALLTGGGAAGGYFTRGQIVRPDGEAFLVAYRLATKPIDLQAMLRGGMRPDQLPKPEPPTAETELRLALIHLPSIGHLTDLQPFDLAVELAGGDNSPEGRARAQAEAAKAAGLDNLRQLGVALIAYAADGDKRLPPLNDLAATRQALLPYTSNKDLFGDPPYRANAALAGKKLHEIAKPAETAVLYETQTSSAGRGVLFLDGHVARVPETEWPTLKKASGIP
jgi:prepilin-type processing-associated H-X9-DG protein